MAMKYFENYLANLARTPNEEYRELKQETINSVWEDTTELFTIKQEQNFDFIFEDVEVWLDTVTDAIVNTNKDVDDYREVYFKDVTHKAIRGNYFQFEDNYWLCYESSNVISTSATCKVRRCNNILKWVTDKGEVIEYPCVIDYNLQSPSQQVSKTITTANGHITIIVQGNDYTRSLEKNKRFLFNGIPYKYIAINNYMQNEYVNENTPLLFIEMYIDVLQNSDNLGLGLANDTRSNFKVIIEPHDVMDITTSGIHSVILGAHNIASKENDEALDVGIEIEVVNPNILNIQQEKLENNEIKMSFECTEDATVGDMSKIIAKIKGNDLSTSELEINVVETSNKIQLVPNGEIDLYIGESTNVEVYKDNKPSSITAFNISMNDVPENCYELETVVDGEYEYYKITNKKYCKQPLIITLKNESEEIVDTLTIHLKNLF